MHIIVMCVRLPRQSGRGVTTIVVRKLCTHPQRILLRGQWVHIFAARP